MMIAQYIETEKGPDLTATGNTAQTRTVKKGN
jgi:hypothetical protein